MAESTQLTGSADLTKININEAIEFQYWCIRFDCSTDELWDAVSTVGTQVDDVAEYLDKPELASPTLH